MYTLYYSPGTASMVVHLALLEIGVPYRLELVDVSASRERDPASLKLNPQGTVPTLVVDGRALTESAAQLRDALRRKIEGVWDRIDARLRAHGPYLIGREFSGADLYITMLMRRSRKMPKPATEWPALKALADRVRARPSWKPLYQPEGLTEW